MIGRFHTVDPKAEEAIWQSPFVYANSNPINLIDFNGESGQDPETPTQKALYNQNALEKFNQIEKVRTSVAERILKSQGIDINDNTRRAAGSVLNINAKFKDVPTTGNNGPSKDAETKPILSEARIGLQVPEEYIDKSNFQELVQVTGDFAKGELIGEGVERLIKFETGIEIAARGSQVVGLVFYLARALSYYKLHDYKNAIIDNTAAINLNNSSAEAYNNRGLCYLEKKKYLQAIEDFQYAVNINFNIAKYHYNLGYAYLLNSQKNYALEEFKTSISINPKSAFAYYYIALYYKEIGDTSLFNENMSIAKENGFNMENQ